MHSFRSRGSRAFQAHTFVCRTGSGDVCDPDELCPGSAGGACPADAFKANSFVCRESAAQCDAQEQCTGVAGETCPNDVLVAAGAGCSEVTNSSFCPLPETGIRLIYLQDPVLNGTTYNYNSYRLNASNPGQFYYNVFFGGNPGDSATLTIDIPYPFVTQGAEPIQVHESATADEGCYTPSESGPDCTITTEGGNLSASGAPVILISDYDPQNLGDTTRVTVTCTVPATGQLYVTIHLDYGLKKTTAWQNPTSTSDAWHDDFDSGDGDVTIVDGQGYTFSFTGDPGTIQNDQTPVSTNSIKKNPGVNGQTLKAEIADPVANVAVQLISPNGLVVGSATTDSDGVYQITYKHTGKAANYKVKLPAYGLQKVVQLKANGFAVVVFDTLP